MAYPSSVFLRLAPGPGPRPPVLCGALSASPRRKCWNLMRFRHLSLSCTPVRPLSGGGGGGKKKGREKGQLAGWMFWSGRVGRRGAIRPVDRARAPGNGAGSRRVSTGVDERGVRWMRRAHTRARVHPPPAPPRTIHRLQGDRHPFEPWIDESAAGKRPITPGSIIQAPRRLRCATWRIAGTG